MGSCLRKTEKPLKTANQNEVKDKNYRKLSTKKTLKDFKIKISDFVVQNKNKITKEYKMYNPPIGSGAYGEVRKALHLKSNKMRAIKILNKNAFTSVDKTHILKEIKMLKSLDHPYIVKIYEFFETETFYYIVMEYLQGQELYTKLISDSFDYSEKSVCKIMRQLLSALRFIHKLGVMHRDIKSENIIHNGHHMILIDFGNSKNIEADKRNKELTGTSFYIAPEVIKGKYNEKCDIWSSGILLYIMLTGKQPFDGRRQEIYQNILKGNFKMNFDDIENISDGARLLLKEMLVFDYNKRKSAEELLNHPWFDLLNDEKVNKREMKRVAKNMEKFHFKNKLQEAFFMYLINTLVAKDECEELIEIFENMDTNKDGVLSKTEILNGFEKAGKIITQEEVDDIFNEIDKDGNGLVSFGEYLASSVDKKKVLSEEKIVSVFKLFDADKNGRISLSEFQDVFHQNDEILVENWQEMIKNVDLNGDGEIDFEEFKVLMLKLINKNIKIENISYV